MTTQSNQTINQSNSWISGTNDLIYGDSNNIHGNKNIDTGDKNQIYGESDQIFGSHNLVSGGHDIISGSDPAVGTTVVHAIGDGVDADGSVIYNDKSRDVGANDTIYGSENYVYDGHSGGRLFISGDDNIVNDNFSDKIDVIGNRNSIFFYPATENNRSTIRGLITGDSIHIANKETFTLSSSATGTTLHLDYKQLHSDILFVGASKQTIENDIIVSGKPLPLYP
jgi:hypothetical protein